ncbi:MAG: 1,4-dihydroxy-2-naphthoate polyprenyltransferase [Actinomycetota bacterium]
MILPISTSTPPSGLALWLAGSRPKTLPAAVVPVAIGTAAAVGEGGIIWWRAVAALIVSLAIQVATNFANDYSDGVRGTDDDRVGPLRLTGSGLVEPRRVKYAAIGSFGIAAIAGLALAAAVGWELLVVGAISFVAGWTYTGGPKPYGYLGLGEVFVFVFFGLVATLGSMWVQVERLTAVAWGGAVVAGLLATALLVTNNLRDIPTDAVTGKRTLAVRMGDRATRLLFVGMLVATFVVVAVVAAARPPAAIALLAAPLAIPPSRVVLRGATGLDLVPVLAATGRLQLVAGLLLAVGLALGG